MLVGKVADACKIKHFCALKEIYPFNLTIYYLINIKCFFTYLLPYLVYKLRLLICKFNYVASKTIAYYMSLCAVLFCKRQSTCS